MQKQTIIVTGANGQLGKELSVIANRNSQFNFIFFSRSELAIDDENGVQQVFQKNNPSFCINCAAYTAVDKAESEKEIAERINATAVGILADECKKHNCRLIHISTDYVLDGNSSTPLKETDATNPVNVYGETKLKGEKLALKKNDQTIIIRTSWVYSEFGNNFVKTMMRLMSQRDSINVVSDQIGSPTYAADLAEAIMNIISSQKFEPGIYNYSNKGQISWYDFALRIRDLTGSNCKVNPISTSEYPAPAKRPHYSLLDKSKIIAVYNLEIKDWRDSLITCLAAIKKQEL